MVQTATKRKSESALPPFKSRKTDFSQSPSPEGDRRSSDGISAPDASVAAKRVKKRSRHSEPAPKTRVSDEYDEDAGRIESQTFLALVEFEAKKKLKSCEEKKGYMEKFGKGVGEAQAKLKMAMGEGQQMSRERDDEFLKTFKNAYGAARGNVPVTLSGQRQSNTVAPAQEFAAMYSKSKEITANAFALIAKFEEVAKRVEEIDTTGLIENEWGEVDEKCAEMLLRGKKIGIERYRRMLNDSKKEIVLEGDDKKTSAGFYREGNVEGCWGRMAKKQEKALRKLGKMLEIGVEVA